MFPFRNPFIRLAIDAIGPFTVQKLVPAFVYASMPEVHVPLSVSWSIQLVSRVQVTCSFLQVAARGCSKTRRRRRWGLQTGRLRLSRRRWVRAGGWVTLVRVSIMGVNMRGFRESWGRCLC
jgi:hypothetical protein